MNQAGVAFDYRHSAAKPAHCLREFQADKPAAQDNQMFRNTVKFQRFNMCQRLGFAQTGSRLDGRMGANIDDDAFPLEQSHPTAGESDLNRLRSNKPPRSHYQSSSAVLVIIQL